MDAVRLQVRVSELKEELNFIKQGLPVVDRAAVAAVVKQLEARYSTEVELENRVRSCRYGAFCGNGVANTASCLCAQRIAHENLVLRQKYMDLKGRFKASEARVQEVCPTQILGTVVL